jgi:hypothetical protein
MPLVMKRQDEIGATPFATDKLSRKKIADRLTRYVAQSSSGCVIGITAPWGDGKSWFGRNWEAQLNEQNHKTLFLDVFKNDFCDDAFTSIAAEILRVVSSDKTIAKKLLDKTKKLGVTLLPTVAKVVIAAGAKVITGLTPDQIDKIVEDVGASGTEAAEKYVEKRILEHQKSLDAVSGFQKVLSEWCKKQEKPVVFFVDELDRCRPNYAVKVIEHIKHFFDVPNLVFVLLVNRDQLEKSIHGVYGQGVDAASYLGKFINVFFSLPTGRNENNNMQANVSNFLRDAFDASGLEKSPLARHFLSALQELGRIFQLSLREMQQVFIYVRLIQPSDYSETFDAPDLLAFLITVKIKRPEIFALLLTDYAAGSAQVVTVLEALPKSQFVKTRLERISWRFRYDAKLFQAEPGGDVDRYLSSSHLSVSRILHGIDLPEIDISSS